MGEHRRVPLVVALGSFTMNTSKVIRGNSVQFQMPKLNATFLHTLSFCNSNTTELSPNNRFQRRYGHMASARLKRSVRGAADKAADLEGWVRGQKTSL
jgi:hypothetical protein